MGYLRKFNYLYYLVFIGMISASPPAYLEIGMGFHQPQTQISKYVDPGFSMKASISKSFSYFPIARFDTGFRYVHFKTDRWNDGWALTSGEEIPVDVENTESSIAFLFGLRIMNPTHRGAIRPYCGLKMGLFNFSEKTRYDWGQGSYWYFDWEDDEWEYHEDETWAERVNDSRYYSGWIIEVGTSIYAVRNWGLDIGIQYDLIPGLVKSGLAGIENDVSTIEISSINKKVNADYLSIYAGVSIPLSKRKK